MQEFKEDKITFIKQQDIDYIENSVHSVEKIFELSIIKDLIKSRLKDNSPECFGFHDDQDEICKSCWLAKTGKCQELQAFLKFRKTIEIQSNTLLIKTRDGKDTTLTIESIQEILTKLNIRESCATYKIVKAILESDNCPFSDIIQKIWDILGEDKSPEYVKVRFYQVKSLIESKTDLKLNIITQKFLQIGKQVKQVDEVKSEQTS